MPIGYDDFYNQSKRPQYGSQHAPQDFGGQLFNFAKVNPLVDIGTKLGGGLIGLLGGKSKKEKQRSGLFDFLSGLRGKQAINPQSAKQFIPQIEQSLIPFLNQKNRSAANRVGLGSGVGTGEILRESQGQFGSQLLDIMRRIQEINAQRPLDIARTQAGLV